MDTDKRKTEESSIVAEEAESAKAGTAEPAAKEAEKAENPEAGAAEASAVEAVEKEIRDAEAVQEEKMSFTDKLRKSWDRFAFQNRKGSLCIKAVLTLAVFLSMHLAFRYGLSDEGSLLQLLTGLVSRYTDSVQLVVLGAEALLALLWVWMPAFGTFLCAAFLYIAYAGMAPVAMALASMLLILFQLEDRPVSAAMIGLPVLVFHCPLPISLMAAVFAAFVSTRKNDGLVRSLGFVYLALLEMIRGSFGIIYDAKGAQVLPVPAGSEGALQSLRELYHLVEAGNASDGLFIKLLLPLAFFLIAGAVFAKVLDKRKPGRKLGIDAVDGIIFSGLSVLLTAASGATVHYSILTENPFPPVSVVLQVFGAYVLTRPVAGKSPLRRNPMFDSARKYIFISYAHADLDTVRPYLKILSRKGYEFWYDDSIKTGTEWQGVIASNLANCSAFLCFISRSSIQSEYCLKEINYATSKQKPIAVIMLDDVKLPPVLEMHFASLQAVQRSKFGSTEACMEKVMEMEELEPCRYEEPG